MVSSSRISMASPCRHPEDTHVYCSNRRPLARLLARAVRTEPTVGPGSYNPQMGERLAEERRAISTGKAGAQSYPFSATDRRGPSAQSASKLMWVGALVDGELPD